MQPKEIECLVSTDSIDFRPLIVFEGSPTTEEIQIENYFYELYKSEPKWRYLKIKAKNFGKLPKWHQGAGGEAYIFIDEITVK